MSTCLQPHRGYILSSLVQLSKSALNYLIIKSMECPGDIALASVKCYEFIHVMSSFAIKFIAHIADLLRTLIIKIKRK